MAEHAVIARRRKERQALVERAGVYADSLSDQVDLKAVVVFGSVARGDFNLWSDVDVLIVADPLPDRLLDRLALGVRPGRIQPVLWTTSEWERQSARANPIVTEALNDGIWLVGSPSALTSPAQRIT